MSKTTTLSPSGNQNHVTNDILPAKESIRNILAFSKALEVKRKDSGMIAAYMKN